MAKAPSIIASMERAELKDRLSGYNDTLLIRMMKDHYDRHPLLPGEAAMRDEVNAMLTGADEHGTKIRLEDRRDAFLDAYVNTRIREQKFTLDRAAWKTVGGMETVTVERADMDLLPNAGEFKLPDNCVCSVTGAVVVPCPDNPQRSHILGSTEDGAYISIGILPNGFEVNNPDMPDWYTGSIQILDYSSGKMNTVNATLVVDVDPEDLGSQTKVVRYTKQKESDLTLTAEDLEGLDMEDNGLEA